MVLAALPRKGEEGDLPFLGPLLPDDVAQAIAEGVLQRPRTRWVSPSPLEQH